jgi:hypothetical protein
MCECRTPMHRAGQLTAATRALLLAGAGLALLCLAACAFAPTRSCDAGTIPMVQDTLYFGTATPQGAVGEGEFEDFVERVVTPRFPQGLTSWSASGQWRGADGEIVREASRVLILVHPNEAAADQGIRDIAEAYKSRFKQEGVLRVRSHACASL